MSWRNGFDPTRLRVDQLRNNVRRWASWDTLRRIQWRSEWVVPIIAFLILATALGLSALSSNAPQPPIEAATDIAAVDTATATSEISTDIAENGYPVPSGDATPTAEFFTPTPVESEPITDTQVAQGYPSPNEGPVGEDTGPIQPFPTFPPPDTSNQGTGDSSNPLPTVQPIPTTEYIPPPTSAASNNGGGSDNSAYPPPANDVPTPSNDGGGTVPFPTTAPQQPDEPTLQPTDENAESPTSNAGEPAEPTETVTQATDQTPTPSDDEPTATPAATPVPPTATARPADVLTGNLRWTFAESPKVISRDTVIAPGSTLTIDPGVEVRLGPNVQLGVAGTLRAEGNASAPVRMVGQNGWWDGLSGNDGSTIVLDHTEIRQAGSGGTALSSTNGALVVRNGLLTDNAGGIVVVGSSLDLRATQITGNAIGGPVVNVQLPAQGGTSIIGNIIGGNSSPPGAPQIALVAQQSAAPIAVEGNVLNGGNGIGMVLNASTPVQGTIRCNAFTNGSVGLQLSSNRPDTTGFNLAIDNNAFAGQTNYGATGTLAFNITNNWWNDPSGPSDARRNPAGRGVPIGVNLLFQPWLNTRPSCAPAQQ